MAFASRLRDRYRPASSVDEEIKIMRVAVGTAFVARHLKRRAPQSISCSQSRTCKHVKRNELHKRLKSPHLELERTAPTPPRNNLSSLEIAAQCHFLKCPLLLMGRIEHAA